MFSRFIRTVAKGGGTLKNFGAAVFQKGMGIVSYVPVSTNTQEPYNSTSTSVTITTSTTTTTRKPTTTTMSTTTTPMVEKILWDITGSSFLHEQDFLQNVKIL